MKTRKRTSRLGGSTSDHRASFSREAFHVMSFSDDAVHYVETKKCRLALKSLVDAAVSLGKAKAHAAFTGSNPKQESLPGLADKMDKLDHARSVVSTFCVK